MIILKQIVVATDFGESANVALRYGRELARSFGSTMHVIHVVDDFTARLASGSGFSDFLVNIGAMQQEADAAGRAAVEQQLEEEDRQRGASAIAVTASDPAQAILDYAARVNADVIVVGTHGRGRIERLFIGSVADKLVRQARCPVLVVRHPEHEFVRPDALQVSARA